MVKITVGIEGMACGMCETHLGEAVRNAFQVKKVTSSHTKKSVPVRRAFRRGGAGGSGAHHTCGGLCGSVSAVSS